MNLEEVIIDGIQEAVNMEGQKIFEQKKKEMVEDLERRKNEIVSGIVIGLMKHVQVQTMGDSLTLTIREISEPKK